jgi:hypothetical protein
VTTNPLFGQLFGAPTEFADQFVDYVESYKLVGKTAAWVIQWKQLRIADPFVQGPAVGVECWFALPKYADKDRHVAVIKEPGLFLDRPVLGIVDREKVRV